ncbi:MAG: hypothetical protein ACOWW1_02685 [archaeon]
MKATIMGRFGNTFQKIKNKIPSTEFTKHKHGECINFDNGTCKATPRGINLTNLNPKGPACIHFKLKNTTETEG